MSLPGRQAYLPVKSRHAARNQVSSRLLHSKSIPFGRTNMAELVRGDGGGFLAGSLVAALAVFGIFFLTLTF
jgi:hypothetical protein